MILCTVRNTGSNFFLKLLEPYFERYNGLWEVVGDNPMYFTHAETEKMSRIHELIDAGHPLVRTMRHPDLVAQSWMRRGWPLDFRYTDMWRNLFSLKGDLWLSVDSPHREEMLRHVGERLGIHLETNWEVVGHFNGDRKGQYLDHSLDYDFSKFYPVG